MPSSRHDLHLHEQLLLLALRDRKGTVDFRAGHYNLAMGGAILAELALGGLIRIEESRKARVEATPGHERPRDEILAEALDRVRNHKRRRPAPASTWVSTFGTLKRLRHRTATGLCRRGILRATESQILLVFTRKLYPTIDPGPERRLVGRLRNAVMGDGEVDPRLGVVLSMAHATGSLRIHFEPRELKARKARLKAISAGEVFAAGAAAHPALAAHQATKAAVAATQAAVLATQSAIVAAATASSVSSSN